MDLCWRQRLDSLFQRLPDEFCDAFLKYGSEFAVEVVQKRQWSLFDPMVSDWSCQIRALWVGLFLKKIPFEKLEKEDLLFLGLVRFLCDSAICLTHTVTGTIPLRTNVLFWDDAWPGELSRSMKGMFYGKAKQIVAERTLNDLFSVFKNMPSEYIETGTYPADKEKIYSELKENFQRLYMTSFSGVSIPMLPFFHGLIIVFSLAAYFKVPLLDETHYISLEKETVCSAQSSKGKVPTSASLPFCLMDRTVESFVCQKGQQGFQPSPLACGAVKDPSIVFRTYCFEERDSSCLTVLERIKKGTGLPLSFVDLVYIIGAQHEICPKRSEYDLSWSPCVMDFSLRCARQGRETGLIPNDVVNPLYRVSQGEDVPVHLHVTLFDVVHVYSASFEEIADEKFQAAD